MGRMFFWNGFWDCCRSVKKKGNACTTCLAVVLVGGGGAFLLCTAFLDPFLLESAGAMAVAAAVVYAACVDKEKEEGTVEEDRAV